jgi:hypothetical protein
MTGFDRSFARNYIGLLRTGSIGHIATALALGVLLGLATLVLDPILLLGAVTVVAVVLLTFAHPEIVILVVLVLVSGVVPTEFNPPIKLPLGTFHPSDLLLIWLVFFVAFRVFTDKSFSFTRTPLDAPVGIFFAAVIVAMGTSMFGYGLSLDKVQIEARKLMYYLVFFAVTNLIKTRSQIALLVHGLMAIGLLVAITGIAQAGLGGSVSLVGGSLSQQDYLFSLKFHPGAHMIFIALMMLATDMSLCQDHPYHLLRQLQFLVLILGFSMTFARNFLVSLAVSLAALVTILWNRRLSQLFRNLFSVAIIAIVILGALAFGGQGPVIRRYAAALLARMTSIFSRDVVSRTDTLLSRWVEIRYAWAHIVRHPILGIGLYRPYRPLLYEGDRITRYVHNAYISIWLKTGLLGLVPFLWLSVCCVQRGIRHWQRVQDDLLHSASLGIALAYLGMMVSNLVAPFFVQNWSLAVFGVMLGINESICTYERVVDGFNNKGESIQC